MSVEKVKIFEQNCIITNVYLRRIVVVIFFLIIIGAILFSVWYQEQNEYITIASWYIYDFNAEKARNEQFIQSIANIIKQYDIVAIQGINNINEYIDEVDFKPSCDLNKNANETAEYHLIENQLENHLPEHYKVLISQQSADERFAVIFNKNKIIALASGILLPNISQTSQLCDLNANDSSMKRSPFLVPFRAGNYTFAIMTADVDSKNLIQEMNVLRYNYGYIAEWYGWNFGDVFLVGNNIEVNEEMVFNEERYFVDDNFITLNKVAERVNPKQIIYGNINVYKVKMIEK